MKHYVYIYAYRIYVVLFNNPLDKQKESVMMVPKKDAHHSRAFIQLCGGSVDEERECTAWAYEGVEIFFLDKGAEAHEGAETPGVYAKEWARRMEFFLNPPQMPPCCEGKTYFDCRICGGALCADWDWKNQCYVN